jgi:23S rRNA (cytosine1962-C5)-methyltransferase
MSQTEPVRVSMNAARSVRSGFPWVYRTELDLPFEAPAGAVVEVVDAQQVPLGQAFWARASPIALRFVTRKSGASIKIDAGFFEAQMADSLARRRSLFSRDAFRVIHGEADGMPGFFVDKYGDTLTVQCLSEGAEVRKEQWAQTLASLLSARAVVSRDDASGRDFEQLPREKRVLWGTLPDIVCYHEGQARFEIDILNDSKTGSFLDQVDNHLRAGELAHGTALDTFSYHGGFALALANTCDQVISIEQDPKAAKRVAHHAALNGRTQIDARCQNAFDALHEFDRAEERFDVVIIDPPGLAKRKEGLDTAKRAYHELNLRAMKLVRPGGLLVSCSCSGRVSRAMFESLLIDAARDAKRDVQIIERRGAGIDHPVLPGLPESEYLKAYFLRMR